MREYSDQVFDGTHHVDSDQSDVRFVRCTGIGGSAGEAVRRVDQRITIRNVECIDCTLDGFGVGPVIFENLYVENLATKGHIWLGASSFKHCVLRGKIGCLLHFELNDMVKPRDHRVNKPIIEDNARIYQDMDWALDISEAECEDVEIRGVPAELIRVNGTTQVKVSYDKTERALAEGQLEGLSATQRLFVESSLRKRRDSRFNYVFTTREGNEAFDDLMGLYEILAAKGLLL